MGESTDTCEHTEHAQRPWGLYGRTFKDGSDNGAWERCSVFVASVVVPELAHIHDVCKKAYLEVMIDVYGILVNRETVPLEALRALTPQAVAEHYELFIGPAIDQLQTDLGGSWDGS